MKSNNRKKKYSSFTNFYKVFMYGGICAFQLVLTYGGCMDIFLARSCHNNNLLNWYASQFPYMDLSNTVIAVEVIVIIISAVYKKLLQELNLTKQSGLD